ncbi:hypothetical protein [Bacillus thuringiensis]|uniref:hypothetical protein n=2 Tax=Bacillus thuringiensis TaxID=1428 RepID=UPI000BF6303C|nr:hypothetical protein [Bacillus thuringiensis]KAB5644638.1 hypothetical protein E8M24_18775 [Bacillus thuringiensis]PFD30357.1 hypothetical protein CN278_25670 [Bacillus thuringiensis]
MRDMYWQYQHLEETPFLHSSNYLSEMFQKGNIRERHAVMKHMLKHEVFDEPEYEGYYNLSKKCRANYKKYENDYSNVDHEYEEEGWFA